MTKKLTDAGFEPGAVGQQLQQLLRSRRQQQAVRSLGLWQSWYSSWAGAEHVCNVCVLQQPHLQQHQWGD